MLKVYAVYTTQYRCHLDAEDEAIVLEFAEKENLSLENAILELASAGKIDLLWDSDVTVEELEDILDIIEEK